MKIFVSHSLADRGSALRVAQQLDSGGAECHLAIRDVETGASFIEYIDRSLTHCQYCLLLWSANADNGKWVTAEWEAALHRTIENNSTFLLVGRLEDHPLPPLLAPRLVAEMFPLLSGGVSEILRLVADDDSIGTALSRRVAYPRVPVSSDDKGLQIYISSDLFQTIIPCTWASTIPSGLHLDRLISDLRLPRHQHHAGIMGVNYTYGLTSRNGQDISRLTSLDEAGIGPGDVLWLTVSVEPFAYGTNVAGELSGATFRRGSTEHLLANAHVDLERAVRAAQL